MAAILLRRRSVGVYCLLLVFFALSIFRLHYIESSGYLAAVAAGQGRFTVNIAQGRGSIYDRNMRRLVNNRSQVVAAILPTPQAMAEIYRVFPEDERIQILERMRDGLPFALELPTIEVNAIGIDAFEIPRRYGELQIAPHLIGYLTDEGRVGVAGIERAFDQILREKGAVLTARYHLDAAGRAMHGGGVEIERHNQSSAGGVVLTLDANIQLITQQALEAGAQRGGAVVLDINDGDILAMASLPVFDQNEISASLHSEYSPFINRAISGYGIGSAFKTVTAAAALESGFPPGRSYECLGYINVGGQIFRCNNLAGHGVVDMTRAMQVSCNPYFISLGLQLDPGFLLAFSRQLGMDAALELAPGLFTQRGNLPSSAELASPAGLANFSFGQGSSLATPLQMAQMMAVFAGSGTLVTPRLVEGFTEDGINISQPAPRFAGRDVVSPQTAAAVRQLMVDVVEIGSGALARPIYGSAGGKTSSAQTWQFVEENGVRREVVHAWFVGFYPAENPRYSIAVFVEDGLSGEQTAAPIFKQIADGIHLITAGNEN
ncbi:MAG: penicillin-binding transpeptidase domain-containing protein [Oscillospiraceae bacterium]|nr:penicillin-binding transpeptidase domain-containing protein [Oscillospiraceae bacterium]